MWQQFADALVRQVLQAPALTAEALTLRERFRLRRHRVTPSAEAVAGDVVRIVGRAVEREGGVSALSGAPCTAHRVVVEQGMWSSEEARASGLGGRHRPQGRYHWVRWIDEVSPADLLVEDATGTARCRLADARVLHWEPIQWLYGATPALTERFRIHPETYVRWFEVIVKPAAEVTVLGIAHWEKAAEQQSTYRGTPRNLVIQAPPRGQIDVLIG